MNQFSKQSMMYCLGYVSSMLGTFFTPPNTSISDLTVVLYYLTRNCQMSHLLPFIHRKTVQGYSTQYSQSWWHKLSLSKVANKREATWLKYCRSESMITYLAYSLMVSTVNSGVHRQTISGPLCPSNDLVMVNHLLNWITINQYSIIKFAFAVWLVCTVSNALAQLR